MLQVGSTTAVNFDVEIEGIDEPTNTDYVSVSGITSETLFKSDGSIIRKARSYMPVILERVYKGVDPFYGWRLDVENGNIVRRDVTITEKDSAFRAIRVVQLAQAWPSKWELPDMDPSSSEPGTETITLTVASARALPV